MTLPAVAVFNPTKAMTITIQVCGPAYIGGAASPAPSGGAAGGVGGGATSIYFNGNQNKMIAGRRSTNLHLDKV